MEQDQESFSGWHLPENKTPISEEQAAQLPVLEKVVFKDGRFEELVGDAELAQRDGQEGKIMTSPTSLLRFVRETAEKNGVLPWDVTQSIRALGVSNPEEIRELSKKYKETIAYVSDIHGGDETLFAKLDEIAQNPPEAIIFGGDIIGTKSFEDLQRTFYNWLNNHSRNEILKSNPDATDEQLLEYAGTKPPEDGFTLKDGFLKLRKFELELSGKTPEQIEESLKELSNHDIAEQIRRYAKFVHYGHYASNLPEDAKQKLAQGLEENAQRVLHPIKEMQSKGCEVHMLEGNWDARAPIDLVPGIEDVQPLPDEQRVFNPKTFFEANGVPFHQTLDAVETDTTVQILLPFDAITNFDKTQPEVKEAVKQKVDTARQNHKTIIVVAHGEPNWEIHNLTNPSSQATGEHALVVNGLTSAVKEFSPDEIVYGHLHDPLTTASGEKVDPNTKYALKLKEGSVELVKNSDEFDSSTTVASHMRFRQTGNIEVSRKNKERKVEGFGGKRAPFKPST